MVELDSLPATRDAYDAVATRYAQHFTDTLRDRPLERALLAAFAESVRAGGEGEVADLGCGPGHITAHLQRLGLRAFGVDASPAMIGLAQEANPELRFEVGSMAALDIAVRPATCCQASATTTLSARLPMTATSSTTRST